MISLVATELRRAGARRLVRVAAIAAFIGIGVAATLTAVNSHGPTDAQLAEGQRFYQQDLDRCLAGKFIRERDLRPGQTMEEFCDEAVLLSNYLPNDEFHLSGLPNIVSGTSILLILGALLIGASLVGAEWHAGTMTTLLTWEPRRLRVLVAKTIAAAVVTFVLSVALLIVLSGLLWLVASTRGVTEGLKGGFWGDVAGGVIRASAAASIASLIGLAVAMVGRNTAAAIGLGFAYLGVVEQLIRGLRPAWQPMLLGDNMAVFVDGGPTQLGNTLRTATGAAFIVGCYVAALFLAAAFSFRVRDVN
jgi:ABC-type transport system involved in multi-copper enzyme maturation permease subunit